MNNYDKIKEMVEKNGGIIYTKELDKNKIHRQFLKDLEQKGYLKKVIKGLYARYDVDLDEFWIISQRYKKGVYSHNTALYFYGLTDRTPIKVDMTFPSNIRVKDEYLNIHYIKEENHLLGITEMQLGDGKTIVIYDLERTICDIIRDKNKIDPQIFNIAMKEYGKIKNKNYKLLYQYSKELRIEKKLRQYMEVID